MRKSERVLPGPFTRTYFFRIKPHSVGRVLIFCLNFQRVHKNTISRPFPFARVFHAKYPRTKVKNGKKKKASLTALCTRRYLLRATLFIIIKHTCKKWIFVERLGYNIVIYSYIRVKRVRNVVKFIVYREYNNN